MRKLEPGRLVIASHNAGKVREILDLLGPYGVEPVSAGALPVSAGEHHDILDKIAAGQAAAAGRALFDHVMGSRERMHRATKPSRPGKKR